MKYPKPDEWPKLIEEYRTSGLQQKEFAAKHDVEIELGYDVEMERAADEAGVPPTRIDFVNAPVDDCARMDRMVDAAARSRPASPPRCWTFAPGFD